MLRALARDPLVIKVTRVDTQAHRIILSAKAWLNDQDQGTQGAFQERFKPNPPASDEVTEITEEPSDAGATT